MGARRGAKPLGGIGATKNTPRRNCRKAQPGDQRRSRRLQNESSARRPRRPNTSRHARRVRQAYRGRDREVGQGDQVRGHQAGLMRHRPSVKSYSHCSSTGRPKSRLLKQVVAIVLGSLFLTCTPGFAQKPVQTNVDQRVVVALRVPEAALHGWLPQPWQVSPVSAGPSKDANVFISFIDRLVNHDADGKLIATGVDRVVSIAIPARNPETGETAPFA